MKKKYLLAVSGGPDSMFLLDWYKNKNVVVAHVNYHKRDDSNNDERIVREFCRKHSLPLEVFNVKEKHEGNFQDWARDVRYNFFKEVYDKYSCNQLLTAHHKDDFLETAWMQMQSKRTPKYFGIKQKVTINGMNIYRPFIDLYWKDEIIENLKHDNIEFATDWTNDEPMYERNKVRLEFKSLSRKEKQSRYKWFVMSNKILKKKNKVVEKLYLKWEKLNFPLDFIRNQQKHRESIIFELIHRNFENIKVSSSKLEGLLQFVDGQEGSKNYYIDKNHYIRKENKKLKFGNDM